MKIKFQIRVDTPGLTAAMMSIAESFIDLVNIAKQFVTPPNSRGLNAIAIGQETGDDGMKKLIYKAAWTLPSDDDKDTVNQELTVDVGDDTETHVLDRDVDTFEGIKAPEGEHVVLSLVNVDGAGNKSATPNVFEFDATDTIPPPNASGLGVTETGEVDE